MRELVLFASLGASLTVAVPAAGQGLPTPENWFAEDLPVSESPAADADAAAPGRLLEASVRLPPGFSDREAADYWSYVLFWRMAEGRPEPDTLAAMLSAYYGVLGGERGENVGGAPGVILRDEPDGGVTGAIALTDFLNEQEPVALTLRGYFFACENREGETGFVAALSPRLHVDDDPVWLALRPVAGGATC